MSNILPRGHGRPQARCPDYGVKLTVGVLWGLAGCRRLRRENTRLRAQLQAVREELARQSYAARHDELTGLPNRRQLAEDRQASAAMMIDLDGFKVVNDGIGHDAGDQVLKVVARRLVQGLGYGWLPLRLGGDEFAAIHRDEVVEEAAAAAQAGVLAGELARPMLVGGRWLRVGCSIGLAVRAGPEPVHVLLRAADTALAVAKRRSGPPLPPGGGQGGPRAGLRFRELPHAVLDEDLSMLVVVNGDDTAPVRPVRVVARVAAPGDASAWAAGRPAPWPAAGSVSPAGRTGMGVSG